MRAVYRRIACKLGFVTSWSRAISMSCLCRNSSNIRIRIADEIPLIFSVATLYIYMAYWGWAAQNDYGLCGVACRVLLRVLSRYDNSRSVRSFLLRFGLPDRVIFCCSSSVGETYFPPDHIDRLDLPY